MWDGNKEKNQGKKKVMEVKRDRTIRCLFCCQGCGLQFQVGYRAHYDMKWDSRLEEG